MIQTQIFDGLALAELKLTQLAQTITHLRQVGHQPPGIAALYFSQDKASQLYTSLKKAAADRVGIKYITQELSLTTPVAEIQAQIQIWNQDPQITGIIIQKPSKKTWTTMLTGDFAAWWQSLTSHLAVAKDVDGLHPQTLAAIQVGNWQQIGKVLPATCQAVLDILATVPDLDLTHTPVAMIGRSDLLGKPLFYQLKNQCVPVELLGKKELAAYLSQSPQLQKFEVIISATGQAGLIIGAMIKEGAVIIDAGEPKGDVDKSSVMGKAKFLTPVPGGVGPMTIACLLENGVKLVSGK